MEKREQMYQIIEAYEGSDLSIKAYCEQEGVDYQQFNYWKKKKIAEETDDKKEGFIRLKSLENKYPTEIELFYPNGIRAVFPSDICPKTLLLLIQSAC